MGTLTNKFLERGYSVQLQPAPSLPMYAVEVASENGETLATKEMYLRLYGDEEDEADAQILSQALSGLSESI